MELKGKEIFVRMLEVGDAPALARLETENRDFFQAYTPSRNEAFYTVERQQELLKHMEKRKAADQEYWFGIFLSKNGELIGKITLSEVMRRHLQSCWIGYYLDKRHNGKGYMTEAVRLVVSYAFSELKLHRIEAGVMPHNLGSIQVLKKAGFHTEGINKKNVRINGKWEDHVHLAIINEED
ncbi:alanine acetyltransferase [Thermoactinomyces vulgaris]|jgi:[ribosomal protein S5]-alanine N-acetyltransferase|nr:alanine acetyltransferase [Thermoactinomyces vulgaris]